MAMRRRQQGVQSVEIGGELLRALAQAPRPQMLKELAAAGGMAAAKAHRYLVSYARLGLVEQNPETGLYDLGPFALELGLTALARIEPVAIAAPALTRLCESTGQTAALAVWANKGATIVRWLGSQTPVTASLRVGSVMPLTRSATGGAFLSFLPSAATQSLVKQELADNRRLALQPQTLVQVQSWAARSRQQGFAHSSQFIAGVSGAAAPVFDHAGGMVLALVVLGYSASFEAALTQISGCLLEEAASVSARLGLPRAGDPGDRG